MVDWRFKVGIQMVVNVRLVLPVWYVSSYFRQFRSGL